MMRAKNQNAVLKQEDKVFDKIPGELQALRQWLLWKLEEVPKVGTLVAATRV